jgi:hypothetical protein
MQIVAKKKLQFQDFDITISPIHGERIATLKQSYTVSPSMRPQSVPDWIVNDELFDLAMSDGSIVAIGPIPEKPARESKPEPTLTPAQIAQASKQEQAELHAMLSTPIGELAGLTSQSASYPTTSKGWPSAKSI